jgi:hypothetical protein
VKHPPERKTPNPQDEQPQDMGIEESEIDQILADSFPASDAPPWTLGVTEASQKAVRTEKNGAAEPY